jgi:hypothetical protein
MPKCHVGVKSKAHFQVLIFFGKKTLLMPFIQGSKQCCLVIPFWDKPLDINITYSLKKEEDGYVFFKFNILVVKVVMNSTIFFPLPNMNESGFLMLRNYGYV